MKYDTVQRQWHKGNWWLLFLDSARRQIAPGERFSSKGQADDHADKLLKNGVARNFAWFDKNGKWQGQRSHVTMTPATKKDFETPSQSG